ncbi:MAG: hypothetical protein FWB95_04570 [Treponema sp.]|nr:hypothetical protein [Treponema sp.]
MNSDLVNFIKEIVSIETKENKSILKNTALVSAYFKDLAKDVPKTIRNAFLKCLEHRYPDIIKNMEECNTNNRKELAERLRNEEGFDFTICADTVNSLVFALKGDSIDGPEKEIQKISETNPGKADVIKKNIDRVKEEINNAGDGKMVSIRDIINNPAVIDNRYTYNAGLLNYRKGFYEKAVKQFTDVIIIEPDFADAYFARSVAYQGINMDKAAAFDMKKAINLYGINN